MIVRRNFLANGYHLDGRVKSVSTLFASLWLFSITAAGRSFADHLPVLVITFLQGVDVRLVR